MKYQAMEVVVYSVKGTARDREILHRNLGSAEAPVVLVIRTHTYPQES